jgi:hypothetical protein
MARDPLQMSTHPWRRPTFQHRCSTIRDASWIRGIDPAYPETALLQPLPWVTNGPSFAHVSRESPDQGAGMFDCVVCGLRAREFIRAPHGNTIDMCGRPRCRQLVHRNLATFMTVWQRPAESSSEELRSSGNGRPAVA